MVSLDSLETGAIHEIFTLKGNALAETLQEILQSVLHIAGCQLSTMNIREEKRKLNNPSGLLCPRLPAVRPLALQH